MVREGKRVSQTTPTFKTPSFQQSWSKPISTLRRDVTLERTDSSSQSWSIADKDFFDSGFESACPCGPGRRGQAQAPLAPHSCTNFISTHTAVSASARAREAGITHISQVQDQAPETEWPSRDCPGALLLAAQHTSPRRRV